MENEFEQEAAKPSPLFSPGPLDRRMNRSTGTSFGLDGADNEEAVSEYSTPFSNLNDFESFSGSGVSSELGMEFAGKHSTQ